MKKYSIIFVIFILLAVGGYFYIDFTKNKDVKNEEESRAIQEVSEKNQAEALNIQENQEIKKTEETLKENISQKIEQEVAFMVQAPFGNWKESIFQNGCEEAAMIMAMSWVKGIKTISPQDAQKQIKDIVEFENKKFGYNTDTDIGDMQIVFRDFFHYSVNIQKNISIDDIKNEIQTGNIVLVPAFGRALKNPNYTRPGPVAHMLVIIGYNPGSKEFITNDSGTKHGKRYLYPEKVLFEAIWEYDSGSKAPQPPTEIRKKGMIVVTKS